MSRPVLIKLPIILWYPSLHLNRGPDPAYRSYVTSPVLQRYFVSLRIWWELGQPALIKLRQYSRQLSNVTIPLLQRLSCAVFFWVCAVYFKVVLSTFECALFNSSVRWFFFNLRCLLFRVCCLFFNWRCLILSLRCLLLSSAVLFWVCYF
jgi:hypothetical protein